jgi:hypothetical protein
MVKRTKKKGTSHRRFLWPVLVLVLIIVLASVFAYHQYRASKKTSTQSGGSSQPGTISHSAAPAADNNANNARKGSSTPSSTLDNGGSSTSQATSTIGVQIVSDNITNGNLHIGTLVNGATSGTCSLSASQSGQSTLQLGTSSVRLDVNDYDCGVFNIPTSKFPTHGNWQLLLNVTSDGSSASGQATVTI